MPHSRQYAYFVFALFSSALAAVLSRCAFINALVLVTSKFISFFHLRSYAKLK